MVPTPEKNRAVEVGNPMITGTMNVAPNMATTCCSPMPTVIGADSLSSGATTVPGEMLRPSPCSFQVNMSLLVTMVPSAFGQHRTAAHGHLYSGDPHPQLR